MTFLAGSLSKERLDGRQVANALYGLQGLSDDTPGLRGLLRALSDQVDRAADGADALGPQALSSSLYGLQGLSTELPEVRGLLVGLGRWLQHGCPEALTAQGMGMALYGLQGMRLCPELEALLLALLKRLELSPLDGQAVGNALYGLQSLSSDSPVVLRLLNVLASKLKSFDCKMTEQESREPKVSSKLLGGFRIRGGEQRFVRLAVHGPIFGGGLLGVEMSQSSTPACISVTLFGQVKEILNAGALALGNTR